MRILIVDDSTINNILLQDILKDQGYETSSVLNGRDVLKKIEEFEPDLVLLDLMMPEVSGFDVLRKLKQMNSEVPVIIISAYNENDTEKKVLGLGAVAFLKKPINTATLSELIESYVTEKQ